jgi:enoyl-CoA hydratase/carnithine racemase
LAQAYAFSSSVMADAVVSPAAQEGIEAFLQKRAADFGGK